MDTPFTHVDTGLRVSAHGAYSTPSTRGPLSAGLMFEYIILCLVGFNIVVTSVVVRITSESTSIIIIIIVISVFRVVTNYASCLFHSLYCMILRFRM